MVAVSTILGKGVIMVKNLINGLLSMLGMFMLYISISLISILIKIEFSSKLISYVVVCIVCACVCFCFVSIQLSKPASEEECKIKYRDVLGIPRRAIVALLLFKFIFLFLGVICCIPVDYESEYPDAEEFLTTEFGMDETSLTVAKSLPQWFTKANYIRADSMSKAAKVLKDKDLDNVVKEIKINEIADEMDAGVKRCKYDMLLGIFMFYLAGVFHSISVRCQHYHSNMRRFEKK